MSRVVPISQKAGTPERMKGMVPGVIAGGFVFLSAIRGRHPETNKLPSDPYEQAKRALENLRITLAAAGAVMSDVVKVTLYLDDLEKRGDFHKAWMEAFGESPPARIAVCVADANASPSGSAYYALDVIALAPEETIDETSAS